MNNHKEVETKQARRLNLKSPRDSRRLICRLANMLYNDQITSDKCKAFASLINSFNRTFATEKIVVCVPDEKLKPTINFIVHGSKSKLLNDMEQNNSIKN